MNLGFGNSGEKDKWTWRQVNRIYSYWDKKKKIVKWKRCVTIPNLFINRVSEREERVNGEEKISEEIKTNDFPKLMNFINYITRELSDLWTG